MAAVKKWTDRLAELTADKAALGEQIKALRGKTPHLRVAVQDAPTDAKRAARERALEQHLANIERVEEQLAETAENIAAVRTQLDAAKDRAPQVASERRWLEKESAAFKKACAEIDAEALALADKVHRTLGLARELGLHSENLIHRFAARLMADLGRTVGLPHPREGKLPQPLAEVAEIECRARLAKFDKEAA